MILKFQFFILLFGSELKIFPDLGVVFEHKPTFSATFLSKVAKVDVNFNYYLPDFHELEISKTSCPGLKLSSSGNLKLMAREFFLNRIRAEVFGASLEAEVGANFSQSVRQIAEQPLFEDQREPRAASPYRTLAQAQSTQTSTTAMTVSNNDTVKLEDNYMSYDNFITNAYSGYISEFKIKFPRGSIVDLFESGRKFYFSCDPVSSNGRAYRYISFVSSKVVGIIETETTADMVAYSTQYSHSVIARVHSPDQQDSEISHICENQSQINSTKLTFSCPDLKTNKPHAYEISFGFSKSVCKETSFSDFKINYAAQPLIRRVRQFGEFLALGIGSLFGYGVTHLGSQSPSQNGQEQAEIVQISHAVNDLSDSVVKVKHEMLKSFHKNYKEICMLENLSSTEKLEIILDRVYVDYFNGLEMEILKTSAQLKESAIFQKLKTVCVKMNDEFQEGSHLCEAFLRLPGNYEIKEILVPSKVHVEKQNVGVVLRLQANIPEFLELEGSVYNTYQVPVPTGPAGERQFEYNFVENVPRAFAQLRDPIGFVTLFPLDKCWYKNSVYFCEKNVLNELFAKDTMCINSIANGTPNCKIDSFTSNSDCYFSEISSKLLLLSNQGNAKMTVTTNDGLSRGYGYDDKYQILGDIELLHNITQNTVITCTYTSLSFTQAENSFNISIIPQNVELSEINDNFDEVESKLGTELFLTTTTETERTISSVTHLNFTTPKMTVSRKAHLWLESIGMWKYIVYIGGGVILTLAIIFMIMTFFATLRVLLLSLFARMTDASAAIAQRFRNRLTRVAPAPRQETIPLRSLSAQRDQPVTLAE